MLRSAKFKIFFFSSCIMQLYQSLKGNESKSFYNDIKLDCSVPKRKICGYVKITDLYVYI